LAGTILESAKRGVPLLNDQPGLPIPGIEQTIPQDQDPQDQDNAKILSALLAIECTKLILPSTPVLRLQEGLSDAA
jgi:hypothetical protein